MTLLFANEGLVPLEAFSTFGLSAKPGSTNPIGKFGTGLKYAVAVTLRLGGEFRLWRDGVEYEFYTKAMDFRGKEFSAIYMRRRTGLTARWSYTKLPFTTDLGKHWEAWMAYRELEANCRDEGGQTYEVGTDGPIQFFNDKGRTLIAIDCAEIEAAYENADEIFLPTERKVLVETPLCTIYEGTSTHVYYRGMRVRDLRKPSLYTYEMKSMDLTEDRTSMYPHLDDYYIQKMLTENGTREMVDAIVATEETHEAGLNWDQKPARSIAPVWSTALRSSRLSPRFTAMRDHMNYGIGETDTVSVDMTVAEWVSVMDAVVGTKYEQNIRSALIDAGWRPQDEGPEGDVAGPGARSDEGEDQDLREPEEVGGPHPVQ